MKTEYYTTYGKLGKYYLFIKKEKRGREKQSFMGSSNKIKNNFWNSNAIFIIGIILCRILLDQNYLIIINPYYEYAGFVENSTQFSTLISWLILIISIPFIMIIRKAKRPFSTAIMMMIYFLSFLPVTSLIRFDPQTNGFEFYIVCYWFMLLILYFFWYLHKPYNISISSYKPRKKWFWIIAIIVGASVIFVSGYYSGFRFTFNLVNVYEIRAEETSYNIPTFFAYMVGASNIVMSIVLFYALTKKNIILASIITVIMLLDFGIGGSKSIFFTLIFVYILYFFDATKILQLLPYCFFLLFFISLIEYWISKSFFICSFMVRRVFYIPAHLNYLYYDFFTTHQPDYFKNSFLRHFGFATKYQNGVSHYIGYYYYNRETNANNGLFSDAIMNLGIPGIFIFPFFIILLFLILDWSAKGINQNYLLLFALLVSTVLISGSFTSILLNNGLILFIIMLANYPLKEIKEYKNVKCYNAITNDL